MDKSACYYFFAYAALLTLLPCEAKTYSTNLTTDQSALLSLKSFVTSDPYQILAINWTNSSDVCSWIGVTCGLRHHRVTALNIFNMGLSGIIQPQVGNLSFLVSLNLSSNHFGGTLPQELSLLHRLKFISINFNSFTGTIPAWFGNLRKLENMSLRNNSFAGFIPNSLSNLSNLRVLDFTYNSLRGEIPQELGRLNNLRFLSMYSNHLSGAIPSAIFNISNLQVIDFTSNELSGTLPMNTCDNLPFLKWVGLSGNILSGEIPAAIGKLKSLQTLYLGDNNLNGVVPLEIGNLQNLVVLDIEKSNISGTLPLSIFNSSSLQVLNLFRNNLHGSLSRDIANLSMLKSLYLMENKLAGVLPEEIGKLNQLVILGLDFNDLSGSIPPELFNLSNLRILSLDGNAMSGALPASLCYSSPLLEGLYLHENNLSGAIPKSISNCAHLTHLELSFNRFTGIVPHFLGNLSLLEFLHLSGNDLRIESSSTELSFITSLTNCRSLRYLEIDDNPLDGIIPSSIVNFSSSLQYFVAFNCKIKGSIPDGIGNLSNLIKLSLYDNRLSGNIPVALKHMHKLQKLDLHSNNLEGHIPKCICQLHTITYIYLSHKFLSGPIPDCCGNVTFIRELFLNSNILTSTIPSSLWHLTDLLMLDLSSNSLGGIIPSEIGNLVEANYIDLSRNQLCESIPSTIGKLQNLVDLSLAQNRLEGCIPVSMGSIISLTTLDLSYNNLSGSIPKSFETLQHLDHFIFSFNTLSGEIPTNGPFKNFTMESFKANKALCGIPRFHIPICPRVPNHRSRRNKVEFGALFAIVGVVVLFAIVFLAFIIIRYKRKDNTVGRLDEQVYCTMLERISYDKILQATEQFNEGNLLGLGSFGSVYKGILRDGKVIAVKVFNLQTEVVFRSFNVECEILRNIRHKNLIKVLSSCSNDDFKALLLEYMPNGNLENWLYSPNYCLDVMQRLDIMIDVACSLEYLHHGYSVPIVHCNLKPSNVLLDKEMIGHVGDFGIAKLLGDGESIVLTNTLATLGYIAPEYGLEGLVSTRCDVYSYGVMLMETFTRKRPSDNMFGGDLSLKSWVESLLPQSPHRVIDVNLFANLDDERCDKIMHGVSSILVLALKCSTKSPGDRINMKEALSQLHKIKQRSFE